MATKSKGRKHLEVEEDELPSKFTPSKPKSEMYEKQEAMMNVEGEFAEEMDDEIESEEEVIREETEDGSEIVEGADEDVEIEEHYWLPGQGDENQELVYEPKAYKMYHKCLVEWSCLTLDILPDKLGDNRTQFPHTCYVVAGTQANMEDNNHILLMKWSRMHKTKRDRDENDNSDSDLSDSDDSDDDNFADEDPIVNVGAIPHKGTINRIRVCPQLPNLVSTWSELGKVCMWDITESINNLNTDHLNSKTLKPSNLAKKSTIKPKFSYDGHLDEGFSMDWNPNQIAQFASGDRKGNICFWQPIQGGSWSVNPVHGNFQSSVEAIQWKRDSNSSSIFAAGLVNSNICIVDIRSESDQLTIENSHNGDVNCISWNPFSENLLLSGSDDATIKLWDIRSTKDPLETFIFHREPILSVDWHHQDQDVFLAASLDNSISFWDIAIDDEVIDEDNSDSKINATLSGTPNIPKKLLFLHMGQEHIAEAKWHKQIPSLTISTAQDSFNVFIPSNL
ncbi:Histone-binding protein RBBP4 N-terminal domain/WD40 repeat [Cryptosporidium tyzzeri]|nr:Histone-binding protein RBBP4 N-terminal domain/WD40 repeat [Cryptosporidium tyzzeri]